MENTKKKNLGYWILYLALPIVLLIIWECADLAGILKPYTMPAIKKIISTTIQYIQNGKLTTNIVVSMIRVLEGFFVALISGLLLGISA